MCIYKCLGKHQEDELELKDIQVWISTMVAMVDGSHWSRTIYSKCVPCIHSREVWCRSNNNLYACYKNRNALDGNSNNYQNYSNDTSPRDPHFLLNNFIGHCKYFTLKTDCPLRFRAYSFRRKLYALKWPRDMNNQENLKIYHRKRIVNLRYKIWYFF